MLTVHHRARRLRAPAGCDCHHDYEGEERDRKPHPTWNRHGWHPGTHCRDAGTQAAGPSPRLRQGPASNLNVPRPARHRRHWHIPSIGTGTFAAFGTGTFAAFGSPEAGSEPTGPVGPGPVSRLVHSTRIMPRGPGRRGGHGAGPGGLRWAGATESAAIGGEGRRGLGRGLDNRSTVRVRGVWKGHERRGRRPRAGALSGVSSSGRSTVRVSGMITGGPSVAADRTQDAAPDGSGRPSRWEGTPAWSSLDS